MPSFLKRDRAKRVEPVETKRTVENERPATLIDRVLKALKLRPYPGETAAQTAARIAEPEAPQPRANLLDRILGRLGGEKDPASTLAAGLDDVAKDDKSLTGRVAAETAKLIRENDDLARAIQGAATGKSKPQQRYEIEGQLEKLQAEYRQLFRGHAEDLAKGKITQTEFRQKMGYQVKSLQTQAAILGAGGQGNMTDNQRKLLDRSVRDQLAYLDGFHRDIRQTINAGKPLPGRTASRAGSYASAASVTADQARRQSMADEAAEEGANLWEVRVLGVAEHCPDCVGYAGRPGPIGTLPPIGDSVCGQYCKCHFEYGSREELEQKYGRGAS